MNHGSMAKTRPARSGSPRSARPSFGTCGSPCMVRADAVAAELEVHREPGLVGDLADRRGDVAHPVARASLRDARLEGAPGHVDQLDILVGRGVPTMTVLRRVGHPAVQRMPRSPATRRRRRAACS